MRLVGQDGTGQERTGRDRTREDRTGQGRDKKRKGNMDHDFSNLNNFTL